MGNLVKMQNEFITKLTKFEQDLLVNLNNSDSKTVLDTDTLVVKLEDVKENAKIIQDAQKEAKVTEKFVEESRKIYIPIAEEGSML